MPSQWTSNPSYSKSCPRAILLCASCMSNFRTSWKWVLSARWLTTFRFLFAFIAHPGIFLRGTFLFLNNGGSIVVNLQVNGYFLKKKVLLWTCTEVPVVLFGRWCQWFQVLVKSLCRKVEKKKARLRLRSLRQWWILWQMKVSFLGLSLWSQNTYVSLLEVGLFLCRPVYTFAWSVFR